MAIESYSLKIFQNDVRHCLGPIQYIFLTRPRPAKGRRKRLQPHAPVRVVVCNSFPELSACSTYAYSFIYIYIYIYVCVCICIHACIHIYVHRHMFQPCVYRILYSSINSIHIHIYIYVCICTHFKPRPDPFHDLRHAPSRWFGSSGHGLFETRIASTWMPLVLTPHWTVRCNLDIQ